MATRFTARSRRSVGQGRLGLPPSAQPSPTSRTAATARAPLVLIADDDPAIRSALADLLIDAGYHVRIAASGPELVTLARRERPSAVLLDLAMPGPDGMETARTLRSMDGMAEVPIIAASSSWLADRMDLLAPFGFTGALRKPFGAPAITGLLTRALAAGSKARRSVGEIRQ
jgi:CheY-like chemotaxis protein